MLLRTEGQLTTASSPAAVSRQQLRPYQRLGQKGELPKELPFPVPLGFNCSKRLSRTAVRLLLLLAEYDDAEEDSEKMD